LTAAPASGDLQRRQVDDTIDPVFRDDELDRVQIRNVAGDDLQVRGPAG
jgi:hypothetical protein